MQRKQKRTCEAENAHLNVCSKGNKQWKKTVNPAWNHWSNCRTNWVGDQSSVQRMKIVDSFELTAAKFLMYLFISVHLLYCRYIALNQRILLKKLKNHSKSLKLQQNHKFSQQGGFKKVAHAVRNSELFRI